jgi:hypothetical protein
LSLLRRLESVSEMTPFHTCVWAGVEQVRELLELRGSTRGITSAVRFHGIFVRDVGRKPGAPDFAQDEDFKILIEQTDKLYKKYQGITNAPQYV